MKYWLKKQKNNAKTKQLPLTAEQYLKQKKNNDTITLAIFVAVTAIIWIYMEFDLLLVFKNFSKATNRFADLYLPIKFSILPEVLKETGITITLGIAGATLGSFLAFFAAIAIADMTAFNRPIQLVMRALMTLLRNIPSGIFAIILLMALWFGEFLALIVLTIGTFAFNARLYSDMIDETGKESINALRATGATYWQIIVQGVLNETLPMMISWTLYAVENNIRNSTIIGMLSGAGVGYLIGMLKHHRRFDEMACAVMVVVVVIIITDMVSTRIRRRILQ